VKGNVETEMDTCLIYHGPYWHHHENFIATQIITQNNHTDIRTIQ